MQLFGFLLLLFLGEVLQCVDASFAALPRNVSTWPVGSGFIQPCQMVLDKSGKNVYIAVRGSNQVVRVDAPGNVSKVVYIDRPYGVALSDNEEHLYITSGDGKDHGGSFVYRIILSTSAWQPIFIAGSSDDGYADGVGSVARFKAPCGIVLSPDKSTLLVADFFNDAIRSVYADTTVKTLLCGHSRCAQSSSYSSLLHHPRDVASDFAGNLYIANTDKSTVLVLPANGAASQLRVLVQLSTPAGIAFHARANVLIVSQQDDSGCGVRAVSLSGAVRTLVGGGGCGSLRDGYGRAARFNKYAKGVAVNASNGDIFIVDNGNNAIRCISGWGSSFTISLSISSHVSKTYDSKTMQLSTTVSESGTSRLTSSSSTTQSRLMASATNSSIVSLSLAATSLTMSPTSSTLHSMSTTEAVVSLSGTDSVSISGSTTLSNTNTARESLSAPSPSPSITSSSSPTIELPLQASALPPVVVGAQWTSAVASLSVVVTTILSSGDAAGGALAALGLSACAPPSLRASTGPQQYILSPFVDFGGAWMTLGNLLVVLVAWAVFAVGLIVCPVLTAQQLRYPQSILALATILSDGIVCGVMLAAAELFPSEAHANSGIGLRWCAVVIGCGVLLWAGRLFWRLRRRCIERALYHVAHPAHGGGLAVARGKWMPLLLGQRFGAVFQNAHGAAHVQVLSWVQLHSVVIIVLAQAPVPVSCVARLALLAAWQLLMLCALAYLWPMRFHAVNAIDIWCRLWSAAIFIALAQRATDVESSGSSSNPVDQFVPVACTLQNVGAVARLVHIFHRLFVERFSDRHVNDNEEEGLTPLEGCEHLTVRERILSVVNVFRLLPCGLRHAPSSDHNVAVMLEDRTTDDSLCLDPTADTQLSDAIDTSPHLSHTVEHIETEAPVWPVVREVDDVCTDAFWDGTGRARQPVHRHEEEITTLLELDSINPEDQVATLADPEHLFFCDALNS